MSNVLTGALALIKVNGVTVGKAQSIQFTEDFQRGSVTGLGELLRSEVPALSHRGTGSIKSYAIDYETDGLPDNIIRRAPSIQAFVDNLILGDEGIQLVIFKKVTDLIDTATGLRIPKPVVYATLNRVFVNRKGMNLNENQIGGIDQGFEFLDPIIYQ